MDIRTMTTAWEHGYGGFWRREQGILLRVTAGAQWSDNDAYWQAFIDPRNYNMSAPSLMSLKGLTAAEARAWCDKWAQVVLNSIERSEA